MAVSTSSSTLPDGPLRLLHASDLHLERVPRGLRELPDHLRGRLVDSSYAAARKLFEAAITEQVDAVLLAGDVVDLSLAGPRAVVFLREQFELLAAEGIEVFWAGGRADPPHAWPRVSPLPGNVHVFSAEHVQHFDLHQDGELVARIAGVSRGGDVRPSLAQFVPHPDGLFTIAVTYGEYSQADLIEQCIPYVALGGRHERKSFAAADRAKVLHYPGAVQGISPEEPGPHGATLVRFHSDGAVDVRLIPTDGYRWQTLRADVDERTEIEPLEQQLFAAAEGLRSKNECVDLFVRWQVVGTGPNLDALRQAGLRRALLDRLRTRFGRATPCIWSVGVDVQRTAPVTAAMYDEETILGDVLREIEQLQGEPPAALELAGYLAAADRHGPLAERLTHLSPADHQRVVQMMREDCLVLLSGRGEDAERSTVTARPGNAEAPV